MIERAIQKWRQDRLDREQERIIEEVFEDGFGRPSERIIKGWDNRELHERLVSGKLFPIEQAMAERELRKREAWDAPAGKAVFWSRIAIVISVFSLLWSMLS